MCFKINNNANYIGDVINIFESIKRGETRAKINSRWQPLEMARQWNKDFASNSNHLSLVSNLMLQTAMRAI